MSTFHLDIGGCRFPLPAIGGDELHVGLSRLRQHEDFARHRLQSAIWNALDYRLFAFGSDAAWRALSGQSMNVPKAETEELAGFTALIDGLEEYDRDVGLIL